MVMLLAAVVVLIGSLSVYRGREMSSQLACKDNMRAIHSALQIYWEKNRNQLTGERTYPVDQAKFEEFLADPAYFPDGELRCPNDDDNSFHYTYTWTRPATTVPGRTPLPGEVVITCPVAGSGHGSL
ncbi:MAG: hypothetical protein ACE149_04380 [Armatimonadota bacterium]